MFDYYQFWRNTNDADVQRLMGYFTGLPLDEISNLCTANINRAKEVLAYEATALAHGHEEAVKAFLSAGTKFGFADKDCTIPTSSRIKEAASSGLSADLPTVELALPAEGYWIVKLFADAGLCKSNGDARRLIQGGGASLNDEKITDLDRVVTSADLQDGAVVLKSGKKNLKRVVFK